MACEVLPVAMFVGSLILFTVCTVVCKIGVILGFTIRHIFCDFIIHGKTFYIWFVWPSRCIQFRITTTPFTPPHPLPPPLHRPPALPHWGQDWPTVVEHSQPAHTSTHTTLSYPFISYFENCFYFHLLKSNLLGSKTLPVLLYHSLLATANSLAPEKFVAGRFRQEWFTEYNGCDDK